MNISLAKIFLSIVCNILLLMANNLLVNGYNCFYNKNKMHSVHCGHDEFDDVPQDLDVSIEEITFENSTFKEMGEKSFVRYANLTTIKIRKTKYLNKTNPIHKNVFRELSKLNFLSMEDIFTEFDPAFTLPQSLKRISLSENQFLEHIDLRNASSLAEFYAFDCSLRSFPQFSKLAPLTTVDVRWNPMENWTAENLAPFCLLRNLSIEWDDRSRLTVPDRFCQCSRLENWIKTYNITTRYSLNCTPPENTEKTSCNLTYSQETLKEREECLKRYPESVEEPWSFLLAASLFTVPISTVGFFQLRMLKTNVRKKRAIQPASSSEDRGARRPKSTTRAPEKSERGGEAEPKSRKEEQEEREKKEKLLRQHEEEEEEEEVEEEGEEHHHDHRHHDHHQES